MAQEGTEARSAPLGKGACLAGLLGRFVNRKALYCLQLPEKVRGATTTLGEVRPPQQHWGQGAGQKQRDSHSSGQQLLIRRPRWGARGSAGGAVTGGQGPGPSRGGLTR